MKSSLMTLAVCAMLLGACQSETVKKSAPAAPVHVAKASLGAMTRAINAVGNVQASASVDIIPRVSGEIVEVLFREGDDVVEGQPLLRIDPRPYAAILAERRANLAKSEAQLKKAEQDLRRYGQLVGNGFVSREAYDQTATDAAALRATARADRAAVDVAALDLAYCEIRAPISGRIGELKMQKGAMIKANDSAPIATIDTIAPCRVTFAVPEAHLPVIQARMRAGGLTVEATPQGGAPETGVVRLIDNNVDTRSGTIRLRAEFANENCNLWPGLFVEANMPLDQLEDVVIVPTRAVQRGRDESYAYVAGEDGKAQYRKINVLFERDGKSAVSGDLKPGEDVVVDGQVRLAPGTSLRVLEQAE